MFDFSALLLGRKQWIELSSVQWRALYHSFCSLSRSLLCIPRLGNLYYNMRHWDMLLLWWPSITVSLEITSCDKSCDFYHFSSLLLVSGSCFSFLAYVSVMMGAEWILQDVFFLEMLGIIFQIYASKCHPLFHYAVILDKPKVNFFLCIPSKFFFFS